MSTLSLKDISEHMRDIDICMLTTKAGTGALESRPMSNNREVDYNGDSYFFTTEDTSAARDIANDNKVDISFVHHPMMGRNFYLSVAGRADIVKDRAAMQEHWNKDLDLWFEDGIDTPGIAMIHVKAEKLKYWDGMEEGEIALN